jgi:hypothetical protein
MNFFGGGKKRAQSTDSAVASNIRASRSDGANLDLNKLLASTDLSDVISSSKASPPEREKLPTHEEDTGMIALSRSDGVNHCIINVFKGLSDSTGQTMQRTSSFADASNSNVISAPHALSMSAITSMRSNGNFYPVSARIVHMSDTSNFLTASNPTPFLPKGDIFVHSGNFTVYGAKREFEQFNSWLGSVTSDYTFRIVVLGCRDVKEFGNQWDVMKRLLSNATHVLCHESAVVLGIRFYGSPWHWGHHKNYKVRQGAPASTSGRFDEIPENTQVLITHGATSGILDTSNLPGSKELLDGIKRSKPALHLHGHSKGAHGYLPAFARHPLVVNSALCDPESKVMYACAHVIKATQISGADFVFVAGTTNWNFDIDSLMS